MSETPAPGAPSPAAAASSSKLPLIIGIVVAALVSGGGTYFAVHKSTPPQEGEAVAGKGKEAKPKKPAAEAGSEAEDGADEDAEAPAEGEGEAHVVTLPSFLVNLGEDTNEMHYLKVTVALEAPTEEAAKQLEGKGAKIRNNVLMFLSSLKIEDTQGSEKRKAILKRIRTEVKHVVSAKLCQGVYMTEFVVQ